MSSPEESANTSETGRWVEPLLQQLRARRDRARQVLARQAELLAQLETALTTARAAPSGEGNSFREWLNDFSEQQMVWQQRQDDNWQRQLAMLNTLAEQLADITDSVHHEPTPAAPVKTSAAPAAPASNWEQAKQRLLAELELVGDEPEAKAEPAKPASGSRRPWQQIVAQKDAEIAQLRAQLEQNTLLPAIPLPEAVDNDELIKLERENLRRLQAECQEKLRRAEIEISLERAKLARERQQLEEKLQSTSRDTPAPASNASAEDTAKAPRSRWKARLGLLDE